MTKRVCIFMLGGIFLTACASPYKKTFTATAIGIGAGALYGASRPEFQNQNATMYAALGGLVAGTTALVLDLDNVGSDSTKLENQKLKARLDEFQKKAEPQLVSEGKNLFSSPLPQEVRALVEPGEWKRYKMDQWVQDQSNPNIWYRQVEMFEVTLPSPR